MPDYWLADIALLTGLSEKGQKFLSDALEAKGWISLQEASQFIDIEKDEESFAAQRSTEGLQALRAKLQRDREARSNELQAVQQ